MSEFWLLETFAVPVFVTTLVLSGGYIGLKYLTHALNPSIKNSLEHLDSLSDLLGELRTALDFNADLNETRALIRKVLVASRGKAKSSLDRESAVVLSELQSYLKAIIDRNIALHAINDKEELEQLIVNASEALTRLHHRISRPASYAISVSTDTTYKLLGNKDTSVTKAAKRLTHHINTQDN